MTQSITVMIKRSTGETSTLEIVPSTTTVWDLKAKVSECLGDIKQDEMRLVYAGKILDDDKALCSSFKIDNGHIIRVVSGKKRQSSTSSSPMAVDNSKSGASVSTNTSTEQSSSSSPSVPFSNFNDPFGMTGGMSDQAMRQMMDNPFMQNLMSNPDIIRSIIMSNPQMQTVMENNPEIREMVNDRRFCEQLANMIRNPELMREMQRNNDRALSNIEALPGGFNHLRRMYNQIQAPLESAFTPEDPSISDAANARLARELNVTSLPENQINTQPLPNPWVRRSAENASAPATPAAASSPSHPFSGLFDSPPPMFPWMGMPALQNMAGGNRSAGNASANDPSSAFDAQLFSSLLTPQPTQSTITTDVSPPETRFRDQLQQLEDMGFSVREDNVRALLATGGNVEAAIEYLLSQ